MYTVRRATDADLDTMIEMGRALHDESPHYRATGFDASKLRRLYAHLQGTLLEEVGCVFVVEKDGEIVGMTVGQIVERWFSADRYVTDITLYVKPEHRDGSAFRRLVRALEGWAAEQDVDSLVLGVSTEINAERTVRAYERMGYRVSGYAVEKHRGN